MKHRLTILVVGILLTSACTNNPTTTIATDPITASSTIEVEAAISTETVTATVPAVTTPTPTAMAVKERWHWAYDTATTSIVAVNLAGETKSVGELNLDEVVNYSATPLDDETGLLLVTNLGGMDAYLLTAEVMERIQFPSSYPWDGGISPSSTMVVGAFQQNALVSYATSESWQGDVTTMPRTGPVFFIDGASLTARLVDSYVLYDSYTEPRLWFHASADGRLVRYLDGDPADLKVREVDLQTGESRTIASTKRSPTSVLASPRGDLWYLGNSNLILDLEGNQLDFPDPTLRFSPLDGGKGIIIPVDCQAPCSLQVVDPFGSEPVLNYNLPWGTTGGAYYPLISQLLPDDNLLFVGGYDRLVKNPASVLAAFPGLLEDDSPVFRLSPDGSTALVGAYRRIEFTSSGYIPVSTDGRYLLLKSVDQTHLFIYDAHADRELFSLPMDPSLDYFYTSVLYSEEGILLHATASSTDKQYHDFYSLYLFNDGETITWEETGELYGCTDIHPDGSLACWVYEAGNANLVRYKPESGEKTSLLEKVWMLEYIP